MPVIKARTRGKHVVRHITRLDRENLETLHAYAAFSPKPPERAQSGDRNAPRAGPRIRGLAWSQPGRTRPVRQPRRTTPAAARCPRQPALTESGQAGARVGIRSQLRGSGAAQVVEIRGLMAMVVATAVGVWGLSNYPVPRTDPFWS